MREMSLLLDMLALHMMAVYFTALWDRPHIPLLRFEMNIGLALALFALTNTITVHTCETKSNKNNNRLDRDI